MTASYWITALATAVAVVSCVVLHYEGLRIISGHLPLPRRNHRIRVVFLILSLLALHIAEIWIFGFGYWLLQPYEEFGVLTGNGTLSLPDCVYYSAAVFTTLGFGDIVPTGPIRFMTGMEAISGLTLITWSASFTFLFMQKGWEFMRE